MKVETTTGRASEAQHWYAKDGSPVYEIRGSNGQMRTVTLRDARKYGYLPGYSSIAAMEHKHALVNWQIEQALMSALTLPRLPDETDDQFIVRAREDAREQARKAAERGTAIHAAIQGYYEGDQVPPEFAPHVKAVKNYLLEKFGTVPWNAERSFAHPLGFGGKADLVGLPNVVIDFKCKAFGEEKTVKELAWPEMATQLAAYSRGFGFLSPICLNIFISTDVPGLIRVKNWDAVDIDTGWSAFMCLLQLYQIRKGYFCGFTRGEKAA